MARADLDKERLRAEILFNEMWDSFNTGWGNIFSFQSLARTTIPTGADDRRRELRVLVDDMRPGGPYTNALKDAAGFFQRHEDKKFIDDAVRTMLDGALGAVDAACLVFGHSVLDCLLNDCLQIIYEVDYKEYQQQVLDAKVVIKDIIEIGTDSLIRQKTESKLRDLERRSLPVRSDFIHDVCKPGEKRYVGHGYYFDRKRLGEIDQMRQRVIHGPATNLGADVQAELYYLQRSCVYFWYMLHQKYDLKLIPDRQLIERLKRSLDAS